MTNKHNFGCPKCETPLEKLRATGRSQGMYDDRIELECPKCGHTWMSTSVHALPLLQKKREEGK